MPDRTWQSALALLTADVDRVADRLRGLTEPRLRRDLAPYGTVADAGRHLAGYLADTAATISGDPVRPLPHLRDAGVGDQVAVTGHDLVTALAALTPDTPLPAASPSPDAPVPAASPSPDAPVPAASPSPDAPVPAASPSSGGSVRADEVLAAARALTREVKLAID